jgi:pyrroline-5-carboxylate reductase
MPTSLKTTRIVIIGSGVIAEAMIAGLLRQNLTIPENILASGPRSERGTELRKKYGIQVTTDNTAATVNADVIVLSVKPQQLSVVLKELGNIHPDALVLSIVAGASIKKISEALNAKYPRSDRRRDHSLDSI